MEYINYLYIALSAAIISVLYAFVLYRRNKKLVVGDKRMEEISSYIHEGAMAFLKREYKIIAIFVLNKTINVVAKWTEE